MNNKWEFYMDTENQWRWLRTGPTGDIVGASTVGFADKVDCIRNAYLTEARLIGLPFPKRSDAFYQTQEGRKWEAN